MLEVDIVRIIIIIINSNLKLCFCSSSISSARSPESLESSCSMEWMNVLLKVLVVKMYLIQIWMM